VLYTLFFLYRMGWTCSSNGVHVEILLEPGRKIAISETEEESEDINIDLREMRCEDVRWFNFIFLRSK
jgi:hypothetical protein